MEDMSNVFCPTNTSKKYVIYKIFHKELYDYFRHIKQFLLKHFHCHISFINEILLSTILHKLFPIYVSQPNHNINYPFNFQLSLPSNYKIISKTQVFAITIVMGSKNWNLSTKNPFRKSFPEQKYNLTKKILSWHELLHKGILLSPTFGEVPAITKGSLAKTTTHSPLWIFPKNKKQTTQKGHSSLR